MHYNLQFIEIPRYSEDPVKPKKNGCTDDFGLTGFTVYNISLRRITNKAQVLPSSKISDIRSFHLFIREQAANGNRVGPLGKWTPAEIANMDQTPLEFDIFTNGSMYETCGAKTVW